MKDSQHHYHVLGLQTNASLEDIKRAYKDLAFVWHPDRFSGNQRLQKSAEEKFKEITASYNYLIGNYRNLNQDAQETRQESYNSRQYSETTNVNNINSVKYNESKSQQTTMSRYKFLLIFTVALLGIALLSYLIITDNRQDIEYSAIRNLSTLIGQINEYNIRNNRAYPATLADRFDFHPGINLSEIKYRYYPLTENGSICASDPCFNYVLFLQHTNGRFVYRVDSLSNTIKFYRSNIDKGKDIDQVISDGNFYLFK